MKMLLWRSLVGTATVQSLLAAAPVEFSNSELSLAWDASSHYTLTSVSQGKTGSSFLQVEDKKVGEDHSLWFLHFRRADGTLYTLTPGNASRSNHTRTKRQFVIDWHEVRSEDHPEAVHVTVRIALPATSWKSLWHIRVSGTGSAPLWQVDFPRVSGIRAIGDDQMCLPHYWGRLLRNPGRAARRRVLAYPQPASMQFLAYWGTEDTRTPALEEAEGYAGETGWSPDRSDAMGLYLAAEDPNVHYKRLAMEPLGDTGRMRWWIENIPPVEQWPVREGEEYTVDYTLPYPIAIGTFTGDYHEAAARYHEWASKQIWCRRGRVSQWPDTPPTTPDGLATWTPPWFREIGFWAKFYHEPAKVLPEWAAYRKWLRVPMASHYYRYHVTRFNDNDPEHLPPDPYLLDGMRDARDLGVAPLPYVLSTIWDTDTQSWLRENALANSMKSESGDFYPWNIGKELFAWMCPATEEWRAKMRESCRKLIWEHNMSGVYLDVLSAGSAKGCYDPHHGHTVHGGNYQGQGNRRLMIDLRRDIRQLTPKASFFTEEIDEIFLDVMDGFLTLDLTRSYLRPGEQVWPVFTAVYHPYTINFGSDASIAQDPDTFGIIYGRQFIWGSQPLHSHLAPPLPREGDITSEFFREITQAYYVAGRHFLVGGAWQRIAVRPKGAPAGKCGLGLSANRHIVKYQLNRRDRKRVWTGPAVLASAWQRDGDIAVTMVNITGTPQQATLTVRAHKLGLGNARRITQLWPLEPESEQPAGGEHTLFLPPRSAAVYVITANTARAQARRGKLDETPWELVGADSGPLPALTGPTGTLWACSDGPVLNRLGEEMTTATLWRVDSQGERVRASGYQAAVRGHTAEGHGLPRDVDKKPFALLRKLPLNVSNPTAGGELWCYSGDENHLAALIPGGTHIRFSKPGIAILTEAETGRSLRNIDAPLVDRIQTPEGTSCFLGYAAFSVSDRRGLPYFNCGEAGAKARSFLDGACDLPEQPGDRRADSLADLSAGFAQLARNATGSPGLLAPGGVIDRMHLRLRALITAQLACTDSLTTEHRWFSCGIPKTLRYTFRSGPAGTPDLQGLRFTAIGTWAADGLELHYSAPRQSPNRRPIVCDITALLRDGLYVERVVPLLAHLPVERDGRTFHLCRIFHLEANRPYELTPVDDTVTAVAGRPVEVKLRIRNWAPDHVNVSISALPPAPDWSAVPETSVTAVSPLKNTDVAVTVTSPFSARAGEYVLRFTGTHAAMPNSEVFAQVTVAVVDALVPLSQLAGDWVRPLPEARARIRHKGTFAFHAEAGSPIDVEISNLRVSIYTSTLEYRLLDPDLNTLKSGTVPVDEAIRIRLPAQATGAHFLDVQPKHGSGRVAIHHQGMAELATPKQTVNLFNDPITRWFLVPPGAENFRFGARDGGPFEPAHFIFTSPTSRVAYDVNGNFSGAEANIRVLPEEAGKLWRVDVDPAQDVSFWLTGDVCPYLSTAPDRVLVPAGVHVRGESPSK